MKWAIIIISCLFALICIHNYNIKSKSRPKQFSMNPLPTLKIVLLTKSTQLKGEFYDTYDSVIPKNVLLASIRSDEFLTRLRQHQIILYMDDKNNPLNMSKFTIRHMERVVGILDNIYFYEDNLVGEFLLLQPLWNPNKYEAGIVSNSKYLQFPVGKIVLSYVILACMIREKEASNNDR